MIRPEVLPVPIPADTPVIVVVPTSVLVVPRIIRALMPQRLSAGQHAVTAKTVLLAVRLTPVLMSVLLNAAAAILVPTPAGRVLSPCPALLLKTKCVYLLPNAEHLVMNANITQIAL